MQAAISPLNFTVNMSEAVNVDTTGGTPYIHLDVGGVTRDAIYASGTGTSTLTFTYTPVAGDIDLDGISIPTAAVVPNGGTITDLNGNPQTVFTFSAPSLSNVKINNPSLAMDFVYDGDGRFILNNTIYNDLTSFISAAGATYTRGSTATYFDSTGTLQTAATNTPRFDYDPITLAAKGLMIEGTRTNSLPRSQITGVTTGALGSGGVMPTGWSYQLSYVAGAGTMAMTIMGTGTVSGMPYIDIRFDGSVTSGTAIMDVIFANPAITSAASVNWTDSVYVALTSGSVSANIGTLRPKMKYLDGSGTYLSESASGLMSVSSTLTRLSATATTPASTASVSPRFSVYATTGAIDITLRFAAPQLETGLFMTSYIPTSGSATTRNQDIFYIPTSAWYNASASTLLSDYVIRQLGGTGYPGSAVISDGTFNNGISLYVTDISSDLRSSQIKSGGTNSFSGSSATGITANTETKSSLAYAANDANVAHDGTVLTTDTSVTVPTVSRLYVGGDGTIVDKLNGWVQRIKYYPLRTSNGQLTLMTQ